MINKPLPGIHFKQGTAHVALWAPDCGSAELLAGERKIGLTKGDFGYWTVTTDLVKPGDRYQFSIDGKLLPDPASRAQPDGVHAPSMAIDLTDFKWTDTEWKNLPIENYLIYELHTGTFTKEGTFKAAVAKLDHLVSLGVTAIEIMPVAQFPGQRNWGYDGVFPYAVQNSYGGAEGLMGLVNACHNKGLAVILDVVYNHLGPEGNYFNEFGPYFTGKYNTPWGNALNFDDAWCDEVRHYFIQNALQWFRDFHIDALRLDAVHAIKDFSPKHILRELKEHVDILSATTGRNHHLTIEFDLNDKRFIEPLDKDGYGMDAQWIDEFHHALRVTAGGERTGYYSDFNGIHHLAKACNDAYVYNGIYSPHRLKNFGTKTDNPGRQFIAFSQNHDQVGNRMLGERSMQIFGLELCKLMAGAVLCAPFVPLLFMGEEWGETNPFLYFVSHSEPQLVEAVRKGRKAEFAAFHAEGSAPDPQDEQTFNRSKLQWRLPESGLHATLLNYYKALIELRRTLPALHKLNRSNVRTTVDEELNTLLLERWESDQRIGCLMNFSAKQHATGIRDEQIILNSANTQWGGPGAVPEIIQAQSIIIYNLHV